MCPRYPHQLMKKLWVFKLKSDGQEAFIYTEVYWLLMSTSEERGFLESVVGHPSSIHFSMSTVELTTGRL